MKIKVSKPCHKLGYCPYGVLVEEFPLKDKNKKSCKVFGHDCPVFYVAEGNIEREIE
jgi:hypothetical protein